MNSVFWSGKKVLVTGHTGFKGGWLSLWLHTLGAEVCGISLAPDTNPNLFSTARIGDILENNFLDLREQQQISKVVSNAKPEIVFHLAAQPLVRASYRQPAETFSTNIQGTVHLFESIRSCESARVVVIITTDKVYANREWCYPYREEDALGGHDPYSASKAAVEIVSECYRKSFFESRRIAMATARSGNVIAGGDWSEDRLLPDAIRAWEKGQTLFLRNSQAIRPWQHVLEPLHGYLTLARVLWQQPDLAGAYNFGPDHGNSVTVNKVIELSSRYYGQGKFLTATEQGAPHEASKLTLETAKSRELLGITPRWTLQETISRTVQWYRKFADGADARQLCLDDITDYGAIS